MWAVRERERLARHSEYVLIQRRSRIVGPLAVCVVAAAALGFARAV